MKQLETAVFLMEYLHRRTEAHHQQTLVLCSNDTLCFVMHFHLILPFICLQGSTQCLLSLSCVTRDG